MKKSYLSLLFAILCLAGKADAQSKPLPCATDRMNKRIDEMDPLEKKYLNNYYQQQINQAVKKIDLRKVKLTSGLDESGNTAFWYDIPVVVHIIHDYNENIDYLSDNYIFQAVKDWNVVYAKQNADTIDVIAPFKKWVGNPRMRLHLATIDPNGNPCHGITRHRSYLTYHGNDQAKLDDWAPTSYINIWSVNEIPASGGFQAAAYAYWPSQAAGIPFWDGIICFWSYINEGGSSSIGNGNSYKTINHECGHVMNLLHPWGSTNDPGVACGDDLVDDTPPTEGHNEPGCRYDLPNSNQNSIYDTVCSQNYFVLYTNAAGGDSLVNYPDTTNAQNIMDYTYCSKNFTIGQVARMHAALNSPIAGRNNLWDTANLIATGVLNDSGTAFAGLPDLKPIPEFGAMTSSGYSSASTYMNRVNYFTYPNTNVWFHNETWNDTVTSLQWVFSGGATIPVSNSLTSFTNSFTQPGWVDLKMVATGNNSGTDSAEWPRAIFVADAQGTPALGYFQEFEPNGDFLKWPAFNYYNNEFYWTLDTTVGFDDHYCMKYQGYDNRINPLMGLYPVNGSPIGDFDDLFSVPMDLSAVGASCNLDFMYAGSTRSANVADVNDKLEIDYTTNGTSWVTLSTLSKGSLTNNGAISTEFVPGSPLNWAAMTIPLPTAAITAHTTFRFRYMPNVGADGTYSSGNDFYLDRISFSNYTAGVNNVKLNNIDVAVVPNPTNGDAFVVIKDAASNVTAQVTVTDITGKVVYTINQLVTGGQGQILIPHSAIAVPGMYLVQATTGSQSQTKKLVVY